MKTIKFGRNMKSFIVIFGIIAVFFLIFTVLEGLVRFLLPYAIIIVAAYVVYLVISEMKRN